MKKLTGWTSLSFFMVSAHMLASCEDTSREHTHVMPDKQCITKLHEPAFEYKSYKNVAVLGDCKRINTQLEEKLVDPSISPYILIERPRLETVAKEHILCAQGGLVSPQCIIAAGRIAGVDAVIITECKRNEAEMRFIDTTSARNLAVKGDLPYSQAAEIFFKKIAPYNDPECS